MENKKKHFSMPKEHIDNQKAKSADKLQSDSPIQSLANILGCIDIDLFGRSYRMTIAKQMSLLTERISILQHYEVIGGEIKMKVFIGGSKTISKFTSKMCSAIDDLCEQNAEVLIGDCVGADKLVQQYLAEKTYRNVTIYVSGDIVRNNVGDFAVRHIDVPENVSGVEFYRRKDIAMANDADCGLMFWDGRTKGTLCNINELRSQNKTCVIVLKRDR